MYLINKLAIKFIEIPDWKFKVKEDSAGVYEVSGKDSHNRNIKIKGCNPDELLEQCKQYAQQFLQKNNGN